MTYYVIINVIIIIYIINVFFLLNFDVYCLSLKFRYKFVCVLSCQFNLAVVLLLCLVLYTQLNESSHNKSTATFILYLTFYS